MPLPFLELESALPLPLPLSSTLKPSVCYLSIPFFNLVLPGPPTGNNIPTSVYMGILSHCGLVKLHGQRLAEEPILMTMADDRNLDLQTNDALDLIPDVDPEDEGEEDYGDVPQELTESYGTGVQELPGYVAGGRTMRDRQREFNEADATLTGGDIDANYEQANAVGDESVGGTANTPDMDIVDELGAAVGLEMDDRSFLRTNDILEERDARRWELEPSSSEDYTERRDEE